MLTTHSRWTKMAAIAAGVLTILGTDRQATAQRIDVLHDTILLNNGAPGSTNTQDAEDNFGGRNEVIVGNNSGNARGALLRFDMTSVADAINDPNQVLSQATLIFNTADAREQIQPTSESFFDVYAVIPDNLGWIEGTKGGSAAGWSAQPGSVSQLYLAAPEFEPEDALSPDLTDEFDEVRLWASGIANDNIPVPFQVGIDTQEASLGSVSTDDIDNDGFLAIRLDAAMLNAILPDWLAEPEENPGLYVFPTDGTGQWFFESKEGFGEEAIDLDLVFSASGPQGDFDGSGVLDLGDINLLTAASAGGANNAAFDLDGDALVNGTDVRLWASELKRTWIGDSNLDGEFNSSDLVFAFAIGRFETNSVANWEQGDWNGDGVFSSGDFVAAFTDGGFEMGPRPATAAVPEPTSWVILLAGILPLGTLRTSARFVAQRARCDG